MPGRIAVFRIADHSRAGFSGIKLTSVVQIYFSKAPISPVRLPHGSAPPLTELGTLRRIRYPRLALRRAEGVVSMFCF
jgi:hypothetical protein